MFVDLAAKLSTREDTVQSNFLPHKSFPEKSPVNGTSEQHPKTGAPAVTGYNRFAPKPFSTSAKPFARMFDSPKFNHNLLPNDKVESGPKVGGGGGLQWDEKVTKVFDSSGVLSHRNGNQFATLF